MRVTSKRCRQTVTLDPQDVDEALDAAAESGVPVATLLRSILHAQLLLMRRRRKARRSHSSTRRDFD